MEVWFLLTIVLTLSQGLLATHYLYFSHPGDQTRGAGLYGGPFHHSTDRGKDFFAFAYNCSNATIASSQKGIPVTSFSYDRYGAEVLVTSLASDGRISLYIGQACSKGQGQCGADGIEPTALRTVMYQATFHEQLGPFALYDSQIYFLMTSDEQVDREKTRRTISVRHLDKCADQLPVMPTSAFDIKRCSSHVARVSDQTFSVYPTVRPASTLLAYKHAKAMQFLFQLHHVEYEKDENGQVQQQASRGLKVSSYWMKMYHVHTGITPRLAQPVDLGIQYQSSVPADYLMYTRLDHVGAVSLMDDLLCWTVVESIYCMGWSRDFHTRRGQVEKLLSVGQATPIACDSTPGDDILANVITGVAIVQTQPRLHLIFGCLSQATLAAGSGELFHTPGDLAEGRPANTTLRPLLDGNGVKVKAGSVVVTSSCSKVTDSQHGPHVGAASSTVTCSAWRHIETVVALAFVCCSAISYYI